MTLCVVQALSPFKGPFLKLKDVVTSALQLAVHPRYELPTDRKTLYFVRWSSYLEVRPRPSADISFHSEQFEVLTKDPLVCTNDTLSAWETFSDSDMDI